MPICSRSAKMAPVRAEKKFEIFKNLKMIFCEKSYINGILTVKLA